MASSSADQITLDLIRSLLRKQGTGFFGKTPKPDFNSYSNSGHYVFEFPAAATWLASDWYADDGFGASRIDKLDPNHEYFRSLKVLGTGDFSAVNKAFFERFRQISTRLRTKVDEVLKKEKVKSQIVFTGHSSGGAIAILATVWFLEQYRHSKITPLCVTYGAPLVGDKSFGHALRREQLLHDTNKSWDSCFINVVSIRDLAPRILLSPLKDLQPYLQSVFQTWGNRGKEQIASTPGSSESCEDFFTRLVNNAFAVVSYDSCELRSSGGGSSLLEAVKDIVELSPYRPFGSFHFCVGEGKPLLRVDNHDAVLKILLYSLQLEGEGSDMRGFVQQSVLEHQIYETKTKDLNAIFFLDNLNQLPPSPQANDNPAFHALGLNTEARLSLRAAGGMESERLGNLSRVEKHMEKIEECLKRISEYRDACAGGMGYYDAFKQQQDERDFKANVDRLELVGYWEEVRELLEVFELPDSFEVDRKWVELGTRIRCLVEPIDIANFYRHGKKDQTGLYETGSRARPDYYEYPEKWLEHMRWFVPEDDPVRQQDWFKWKLDSCFWATVENMCIKHEAEAIFPAGEVSKFEAMMVECLENGELDEAVVTQSPTFKKWLAVWQPTEKKEMESQISRIRDLKSKG